jgi:hypothetical protein
MTPARNDRTPNTPRKESSSREKALQDPGLKDYVRAHTTLPMDVALAGQGPRLTLHGG